jgi:hypothetical protein
VSGGPLAGARVPDLALRGAPAATVFGLLHPARFVLLSLGAGAAVPASLPGFPEDRPPAGRLDVVTARLAGDCPREWAGLRSVLIRPDGHVAWASRAEDTPPAGWLSALTGA